MDDLISKKAAIDALRKLREEDIEDYGCEIPEGFNQDHLDRATFAIKQLPPIQPVIVRCKDCKHRDPEDKKCDCGHDILWQLPRRNDWFCADGERRENNENN